MTVDGNGNVRALVKADAANPATSAVTARYAYDGFGKEVGVSGIDVDKNSFRFSTKQTDVETGMDYYGYRYYSANTGRWINRDPLEELDSANLYWFINNNSIAWHDFIGLTILTKGMPNLPGASNCLGGAMTGRNDRYIYPDSTKNTDKSFIDAMKGEGWGCQEVTSMADCKCKCEQDKILISAYRNERNRVNNENPWTDPNYKWGYRQDGARLNDLHAIRADRGCSNNYTQIPHYSSGPQERIPVNPSDPLFSGKAPLLCCCKDKK